MEALYQLSYSPVTEGKATSLVLRDHTLLPIGIEALVWAAGGNCGSV